MGEVEPPRNPHRRLAIGSVIVVIFALIFVFLPVVPYTFGSTTILGYSGSATASVSPSFAISACGIVYNPVVQYSYLGAVKIVHIWEGAQWSCKV